MRRTYVVLLMSAVLAGGLAAQLRTIGEMPSWERGPVAVAGDLLLFEAGGGVDVVPAGELRAAGGTFTLRAASAQVTTLATASGPLRVVTGPGWRGHQRLVAAIARACGAPGPMATRAQAISTVWMDHQRQMHKVKTVRGTGESLAKFLKRHQEAVIVAKRVFPPLR